MDKFKLYYHMQNNGDGSGKVCFHTSEEDAIKADENQDEPFAELSVGELNMKLDDKGNLYFQNYFWDEDGYYHKVWTEIKRSS